MALPEFQREFVWDPNRVVELLDSVANGWPIGSLLIVRAPQPFGVKRIDGGPKVALSEVEFYLLDGQQRVTSLYHALTDTGDVIYYLDFEQVFAGELDPNEAAATLSIRWVPRETPEERWRTSSCFKVSELADGETVERLASDWSSADYSRFRYVCGERLGFLIGMRYSVPAIVMMEDIELEALTRIFETLNRTGVRLDAFDLMVAVLYPQNFHLRDEWNRARDTHYILREMKIEGLEILKLIALWQRDLEREQSRPTSRRVTGIRQRDVLNIPATFVKARWHEAIQAYAGALVFLRDQGVTDANSIPSDAMVVTAAYLLWSGRPQHQVENWYTQALVRQTFAQGANTQATRDIERFESIGDTASALASFEIALTDEVRRNRILRLGLRGLSQRMGFFDPVTGLPFRGPLREVSLPALREGRILTAGDTLIVDLLYVSEEAMPLLRRRTRERPVREFLDDRALASQGFPEDVFDRDYDSVRSFRVSALMSRMAGIL